MFVFQFNSSNKRSKINLLDRKSTDETKRHWKKNKTWHYVKQNGAAPFCLGLARMLITGMYYPCLMRTPILEPLFRKNIVSMSFLMNVISKDVLYLSFKLVHQVHTLM